ncbi:helix-turn-helix domain-containing protein [Streptomyces sp. RM72]|uniref:helix-turn-helix domain-containing protein n=1 Tax=Streptomyces sp. RM72 TaxID=1115510 RepID=UPI001B38A720|nr:helix-turn-helix domain-containing protein [Streptomyces sp. RM72]MBQ0891332.1 helix-turn-helix domain-containing protein [Streptomyces sp. RM72]
MSTTRPLLTQREAATACGVSRTTIRRRREAGELPGAVLDDDRGWLIPVEDLLAAGFRLNAPAPPEEKGAGDPAPAGTPQGTAPEDSAAALRTELERLRHEHALALAEERGARQLAEAEARHLQARLEERGAHIEDLQRALAALTPAPDRAAIPRPAHPTPVPAASSPGPASGEAEDASGAGRRRRWWPRRAE